MTYNDCIIMPATTSSYNPLVEAPADWRKKCKGHLYTCRKVFLPEDLPVIVNWHGRYFKAKSEMASFGIGVGNYLKGIATSEDGQPYMIFCDGTPILQAEILQQHYSDIGLHSPMVKRSDYFLHFHYAPENAMRPLQGTGLQLLVKWLIGEGISRMWAFPSEQDIWASQIVELADFQGCRIPGSDEEYTMLYCFPALV